MSYSYAQERTFRRPQHVRRYELDELFDYEDIVVKLQVAQNRIVEAFATATEYRRGKIRGTGGYIIGVDKQQKALVDHIMTHVINGRKHGIVIASELPSWIGNSRGVLHTVIDDLNRRFVAVRLSELCQKKIIWFNEYNNGTWDIHQRALDQYYAELSYAKEIRKVDERLRREDLHGGGRLRVIH